MEGWSTFATSAEGRTLLINCLLLLIGTYIGIQIGKPHDEFSKLRRKILHLEKKAMMATNVNVYHKQMDRLDREIMSKRNLDVIDETDKQYLTDRLYQIVRIPVKFQ